jgi:hypothetical protein
MTLAEARRAHSTRWDNLNAVVRRASYPEHADPDTVAIAEYYRVRYIRARIIKALSFGVQVTPGELVQLSGIPKASLADHMYRITQKLGCSITAGRVGEGKVQWYLLKDARCCSEIRTVIRNSWRF